MAILLSTVIAGCGGDGAVGGSGGGGADGEGGSEGDDTCLPGEVAEGELCLPAGLPEDWQTPGPAVEPEPGVPGGACGEGFLSDGLGGCTPVLPPVPCTGMAMAVPGDKACRPITDCGTGTWGSIPVDAATVYVDQSFTGAPDGTAASPHPTIGAAVDAAANGATIAIAAGSYVEDVDVDGKTLALWGRCPELVEVTGVAQPWAIVVNEAPGSAVRGLSVTGPKLGIAILDSPGSFVERVFVHDTGEVGIGAVGTGKEVLIADSLVVDTSLVGIFVQGVAAVERCEARATTPTIAMRGIGVTPVGTESAALRIEGSNVHHATGVGIFAESAALDVSRTVVSDCVTDGVVPGWGLSTSDMGGPPGMLELTSSVLARNTEVGLVVAGAVAQVDAVTVEQGVVGDSGYGQGIWVDDGFLSGQPGELTITGSVVRDHVAAALEVQHSTLDATGLLVQRVTANAAVNGYGTGIVGNPVVGEAGSAEIALTRCIVEDVMHGGVSLYGSTGVIAESVIRRVAELGTGIGAVGLFSGVDLAMFPSSLEVHRSRVESVQGSGLAAPSSSLAIYDTAVSQIEEIPNPIAESSGEGVNAVGEPSAPAQLTIERSSIEQTASRGVVLSHGHFDMVDTLIRETVTSPDPDVLGNGRGIEVHHAVGTIRRSEVSEAASAGVVAAGSDVGIEGLWIRDVTVAAGGGEGYGLVAIATPDGPGQLACEGCRIERVATAGAGADATHLTLDGVLVADVLGDESGGFGRGVNVQNGATLTMTNSRVERAQEGGVGVIFSTGSVVGSTVSGVAASLEDGLFGDGVIAAGSMSLTLVDCRIEQVARAAVSGFGSTIALGENDLRCNDLPLNVEAQDGVPTSLEDLGGNLCGCGDQLTVCKAVSAGLSPPEPIPDPPAP